MSVMTVAIPCVEPLGLQMIPLDILVSAMTPSLQKQMLAIKMC